MTKRVWLGSAVGFGCALMLWACGSSEPGVSGQVQDEAKQVGRAPASFPAADEDYFHDMDGGATLGAPEVKGRNTWMIWTGGNDRFWDRISVTSFGAFDLIKTLSSHPKLKFSRDNRWRYLGLVNEPCFDKATGPDPNHFGLWIDKRRTGPDCPPDPFENEQKYKGVQLGARGKNLPVGTYYGLATGIVGLRLFPNPAFDEAAARKWDPVRYYDDPTYYLSKDLVKPYRVGMSCAFCHVGPNPLKPPPDPENPRWEHLSANVGAQYFWIDRIFTWDNDPTNFFFQLFHTSRPGSLDTSLVSTDNINNPRTMNAVYYLGPRLQEAKRWGKESLAGGELDNKQFNDFVKDGPLTTFFEPPSTSFSPRVLKDGADSVGALGALNRVYLNIGLFSEEWLLHFRPLIGGVKTTPIRIAVAHQNSSYWGATEQQTPDMALFFLKTTDPHRLKDAPGGAVHLTADMATLTRGKTVFAERCARCHSSKAPEPAPGVDPGGCSGPNYLDCWNRYWAWTKTDEYKQAMTKIVLAPDFLDNNYLSTDLRVPVTLLETNACSPLATNAIGENIWDNFSSSSYKNLPSVGSVTVYHPVTGEPRQYQMPAGGRGYTRPASLISLWSTAPFLLNNSVGKFEWSPSVEARLASFQNSIEQMLWPEKRDKDPVLGDKIPGVIDRTTTTSYLRIAAGYLPEQLTGVLDLTNRFAPMLFGEGGLEIGPIPAGTPVGLLASLEVRSEDPNLAVRLRHDRQVLDVLLKAKRDLRALPKDASNDAAMKAFANLVDPLIDVSKCPDYVVNRGHYFGTSKFTQEPGLSDQDKRALIEFLKTF
jgi:cytochrome c2